MKPKHIHRYQIKGSITKDGFRKLHLVCSECGKVKERRQKVSQNARKGPQKPRTAIRKVSKGMEAKLKLYAVLRKDFLEKNPRCAVLPHLPSDQIHHVKGRLGKLLLDTEHWLALSAEGHRKVHDNPAWAIANGYIKRQFS